MKRTEAKLTTASRRSLANRSLTGEPPSLRNLSSLLQASRSRFQFCNARPIVKHAC